MTPQELKNSILQLAIQGKLVEQRVEEGTAAELLEKILATKNAKGAKGNLTRSRGARGEKKTSALSASPREEIPDDEKPFDIPESWEWVRLGEVCAIARGGSPRPIKDFITTAADGVNWIKIGDTEKDGKYICSTAEKIKPSGVPKSRMVHVGDFLLTNSMSFGRPYILKVDGCIHDGWLVISQGEKIFDQEYLYWVLSSGYAYAQFCAKVSGAVVKNLNSDKVANSVFPLPPLAEQKRIVAKIEELLPLIDRYEKAWSKLEDFNKRFPVDMQKSLLQMAIQGKLVEQRAEEGTAAELLRDILTQRRRDAEVGRSPRDRRVSARNGGRGATALPLIPDDEKPFDIPESWEWVRLGEVASIERGSGIKRSETSSSGFPCVRYGEIYTTYGYSFTSTKSFVTENVASSCHKANHGDVLCTLTGEWKEEIAKATAYLGKSPIAVGGDLAKISSHAFNPVLLVYFFFAPFMIQQKAAKANGTMIVHIGKEAVCNLLIPLPPLAEQKRIVAKLEELLPLCERLKSASNDWSKGWKG